MTDYYGLEMRGMYFVENTLEDRPAAGPPTDPVVLVAGTFDPHRGEYSARLIDALLREEKVSTVIEAHYIHEGRTGYLEPRAVIDDVREICLDPRTTPRFVSLCGGCLAVQEALLETAEANPAARVGGALFVGSFLPDYPSLTGLIIEQITMRQDTGPGSTIHNYAGHGEVLDSGRRLMAWYETSRLRKLLHGPRPADPFPIPVHTLYFRLDMLNRRGRRSLGRVFNASPMPGIPGLHKSLRKLPIADRQIVEFCRAATGRDSAPAGTGVPVLADSVS